MVRTVNPNASDTPTKPIPNPLFVPAGVRNVAARTALPVPPNTSTNVPRNSAPNRVVKRMPTSSTLDTRLGTSRHHRDGWFGRTELSGRGPGRTGGALQCETDGE